MAAWQASFLLVPRERVAEVFPGRFDPPFDPDYVESLPTSDASELDWWTTTRQPPPGFRRALNRLGPRISTWSPDVEWWGTEDGDRFDVYSEGDRISTLYVRFDMRSPNQQFIGGVADIARKLACDFVGTDNMLYEGTPAGLAVGLRNSSALRFVRDPIAFLEEVRSKARSDG
jgi:hypothetical protein